MMQQPSPIIDAVPHLWFPQTPSSSLANVNVSPSTATTTTTAATTTTVQELVANVNTSGVNNVLTVSIVTAACPRLAEPKKKSSASQNVTTNVETFFQAPPPQPQLPSPNNHDSFFHTFQQWKPSQIEVPPSPQTSDQCYSSESTNSNTSPVVNGSTYFESSMNFNSLFSTQPIQFAQQRHIHHQPLNQCNQSMNQMERSTTSIPDEFKIHVIEELFRYLGVSTEYSQIERLLEDMGDDSDLLAQFLGCAYDHIYEPEVVIIQEEQHVTKSNQFTLSFRVDLKLLRLRALVVFLCFKLCKSQPDQQYGMWLLEKVSEGLLLLDVDALNEISCSAFFDQLQVIEQTLRFEAEVSQPTTPVNVKNNTMNSIRLKSNENNKLIASFEDVTIRLSKKRAFDDDADMSSSSDDDSTQIIREYASQHDENGRNIYEEKSKDEFLRLCLLIHIGKFMTFVKNGQKCFHLCRDGKSTRHHVKEINDDDEHGLSISEILPRYGSYYSNGVIQMAWNREFFVTPKRENTDIYFMVKLGERSIGRVDALFIDHMRVLVSCEDIESYFNSSSDEDSSNSGDSPLGESITVPVSVLHNNRELTCESLQYTFWTSAHFANVDASPMRTPNSANSFIGSKRPISCEDNTPYPMMEDEDFELIHTMNDATIASPKEMPSSKKPRLETVHDDRYSHFLHRIRDPCGFTLLHSAAFRGYTKLVHLLVDRQQFIVDQRDHYHFTALHWACYSGHVELAMFLLKRGASPTLQNMFALTAPDIAEEQNHMELWHAMDSELQRQACCALFTLFTAKNESDDDENKMQQMNASKKNKSQQVSQQSATHQRRSSGSPPSGVSSTGASTCQPATLIKKTPKGVETRDQTMELFIKPSRKKRTYISFFPNELCSSPYKYDILLRIPLNFTNQFNELQFTFHLLIQGTDQQWQRVNQADAVEVVKYLRTMFPLNYREIEWRIMFRVCSFHFHRKPFKFQVVYNSKVSTSLVREEQQQHLMESALDEGANDGEGHSGNKHQGNNNENNASLGCSEKKSTLADDSVVFESEPFFIVARKKKKSNDFFDTM